MHIKARVVLLTNHDTTKVLLKKIYGGHPAQTARQAMELPAERVVGLWGQLAGYVNSPGTVSHAHLL